MKKLLIGLSLIALLGAGCAKTQTTTPTTTQNPLANPDSSATVETTNPDGTKATTQINGSTKQEYDENGVPIINVELGGKPDGKK